MLTILPAIQMTGTNTKSSGMHIADALVVLPPSGPTYSQHMVGTAGVDTLSAGSGGSSWIEGMSGNDTLQPGLDV